MKITTDGIIAIVIIIFSIVYLALSYNLPKGFESGIVGTKALPLVYGCLLLITGITVFLQNNRDAIKSFGLIEYIYIAVLTIVLFVYALVIEYLGFSLSTVLLSIVCCRLFKTAWIMSLIFSILFTLCLVIIFIFLLGISLPIGTIFSLWM